MEEQIISQRSFIPKRFIILGILFVVFLQDLLTRATLVIIVTFLTQREQIGSVSNTSDMGVCKADYAETPAPYEDAGGTNYGWKKKMIGKLMPIFFYGYVVVHPFAGYLTDRYGAKHTISTSISLGSLIILMTPFLVSITSGNVMVIYMMRFIHGMFRGVILPGIASLISHWFPPAERGLATSIAFNGVYVGLIMNNVVTAMMVKAKRDWTLPFYVYGGMGIPIFIIWFMYAASDPQKSPLIDSAENLFIKRQMGEVVAYGVKKVPVRSILLSRHTWAFVTGSLGHYWTWHFTQSHVKDYVTNVLRSDMAHSRLWLTLPYVLMVITTTSSAIMSDWAIHKKGLGQDAIRKAFTNIGNMGAPIFMLAASFAGCHKSVAAGLLIVAVGIQGFSIIGVRLAVIEMSPNYAGFLTGLVNGVGMTWGAFSTPVLNLLAPNKTLVEYRYGYWVMLAVCTVSNLIFVTLVRIELQPWNKPPK